MKGMFKYSGILVLFIFLSSGTYAHKFYVSLCRIRYVQDSAQLQIVLKIFTDDLEKALSREGASGIRLGTDREPEEGDSLVKVYLMRHFRLFTGGKELPVQYVGKEVDYDVTWCYLEAWPAGDFHEITVENDILTAVYPSQINLVEVSYDGQQKGMMLNHDNIKDTVRFDRKKDDT